MLFAYANQMHGYLAVHQRLCFRYIDSTIPLLHKPKNSSLLQSAVVLQPCLCRTWSETLMTGFLATRYDFLEFHGGRSQNKCHNNPIIRFFGKRFGVWTKCMFQTYIYSMKIQNSPSSGFNGKGKSDLQPMETVLRETRESTGVNCRNVRRRVRCQ